MSEFCRLHAFYDCPVCKGESLDWIIPIVADSDPFGHGGHVTGTVVVASDNTVTIHGHPSLPEPPAPLLIETKEHVTYGRPEDIGPISPTPTDEQIREVATLFSRSILDEPWMIEAAARGRAVYERACELSVELGISVADALPLAAKERDESA